MAGTAFAISTTCVWTSVFLSCSPFSLLLYLCRTCLKVHEDFFLVEGSEPVFVQQGVYKELCHRRSSNTNISMHV